MNLILQITAETESKLRELADIRGKDPHALALEALQEKLAEQVVQLPQATSSAEFESWFTSHPFSSAEVLDESRESIY
jgi:hypothetical protein